MTNIIKTIVNSVRAIALKREESSGDLARGLLEIALALDDLDKRLDSIERDHYRKPIGG